MEVVDFRNLRSVVLEPVAGGLTVVTGPNGAGKTSLLEAIAYTSTLSSLRGSPRESLVRNGADRSFVRTEAVTAGRSSLVEIEIPPPRRDRVLVNRQRQARAQDVLEAVRVTVFTPDDLVLVKGGPKERRDFLDDILVSSRPALLPVRQSFERVLRQRAVLLRQAGGRRSAEVLSTLEVWDAQLASAGTTLVEAREELVKGLTPLVSAAFERLTGTSGPVNLDYRRSFGADLQAALERSRDEDLRRQVSSLGPHRDELEISAAGLDARTRLSQGRQRCMTLALRLGGHAVVAARAGTTPVVLLDDAFSELDARTADALVAEIGGAQAILTTAGVVPRVAAPGRTVKLLDGTIEP